MLINKSFPIAVLLYMIQVGYPSDELASSIDKISKYSLIDSLQDYKYTQPERAISFASRVLKRKKYASGKYPKVESAFYNHLGEIYLRMNLPSQALSYYIEAKRLIPKSKAPWLEVQFGNVYYNQGEWIKAKISYNKALEIFSKRKITGARLDGKATGGNSVAGMTTCYSNLGRIEIQLNNYESALSYFELALETKQSRFDKGLDDHPMKFGALSGIL